jgi:hypothetical protein
LGLRLASRLTSCFPQDRRAPGQLSHSHAVRLLKGLLEEGCLLHVLAEWGGGDGLLSQQRAGAPPCLRNPEIRNQSINK